jgi:hypothetical protein
VLAMKVPQLRLHVDVDCVACPVPEVLEDRNLVAVARLIDDATGDLREGHQVLVQVLGQQAGQLRTAHEDIEKLLAELRDLRAASDRAELTEEDDDGDS